MGSGPPPVRRANKLTRWEITPIKVEVETRRGGKRERLLEEKGCWGHPETPLCWTDSPDRKQQMAPEVSQGSEGREKGAVLLYAPPQSTAKSFNWCFADSHIKLNTKYRFYKLCAWKR